MTVGIHVHMGKCVHMGGCLFIRAQRGYAIEMVLRIRQEHGEVE